jgi:hypothetical protein
MRPCTYVKISPRRPSYSIANHDLCGVELDVRFKGQENYSRIFFVPETDKLYLWRYDRQPERFVKIPITSISEKRKQSLLEVWNAQPIEEVAAAP